MTDGHLNNDSHAPLHHNLDRLDGQIRHAMHATREVAGTHPVMTLTASLEAPIAEARTMGAAAMLTAPGLRDVLAERIAQIERHGYTLEFDLGFTAAAIALGGVSYFNTAVDQLAGKDIDPAEPDAETWPWEREAWRPGDARANLVKALAIGLAVLDRIDAAPKDAGAIEEYLGDADHDARRCLEHLVASQVRTIEVHQPATISDLLSEAARLPAGSAAEMILSRFGLRIIERPAAYYLAISNRHSELLRVFNGTPWSHGAWAQSLSGLPDAIAGQNVRIGAMLTRCVLVPATPWCEQQ